VKGGDATGGGAVFSSDGPLYNRVLRKKIERPLLRMQGRTTFGCN
jgi:hypothetical protein